MAKETKRGTTAAQSALPLNRNGKDATSAAEERLLPVAPQQDRFHKLLRMEKTIRIAVTGDAYVTELEKKIIDTADFQRLRGVRQLGNVLHVFPTALHTRFDHSLGTLAMADRMVKAIRNNTASQDEEKKIDDLQEVLVRLYALLHDITHVPFGHTFEDELGIFDRHDRNPERILQFLGPDSAIGTLIREAVGVENYGRFMSIYLWDDNAKRREQRAEDPRWKKLAGWLDLNHDDEFIHDIVSNTVCADLLDYLARDNFFCNLSVTLEYRFLAFLFLRLPDGSRFRRVFVRLWKGRQRIPRRDTLTDLARLMETRYMIAERAYFHHAKIISGAMLGRAVQEEVVARRFAEPDLYEHTDDTLVASLARSEIDTTSRLARAFRSRSLHKQLASFGEDDFASIQASDIRINPINDAMQKLANPLSRRAFEDGFADDIGARPGDVLIYAPPREMNPKTAEMNVIWNGQDMTLKMIDDQVIKPRLQQIIDAHRMLWRIHLLATRSIWEDSESTDLLVERFRLEFLCPTGEQRKRREAYVERLVRRYLRAVNVRLEDMNVADLDERVTATARDYETVSTDKKQTSNERLARAVQNHFKV